MRVVVRVSTRSVMQQQQAGASLTLFYSYADKDERLRGELETHLSPLRREGLIIEWHHRRIPPGSDRLQEIDDYLNKAAIILLLISPDFLASDYCYGIEMQRALERYNRKEACVIPT